MGGSVSKDEAVLANWKAKKKGTPYLIHDNGSRPFLVLVGKSKVSIHVMDRKKTSKKELVYKEKAMYSTSFSEVWVDKNTGGDGGEKFGEGASILVRVKGDTYVHIGEYVLSFDMKGEVEDYFAPVFGSDVVYPHFVVEQKVKDAKTFKLVRVNGNNVESTKINSSTEVIPVHRFFDDSVKWITQESTVLVNRAQ